MNRDYRKICHSILWIFIHDRMSAPADLVLEHPNEVHDVVTSFDSVEFVELVTCLIGILELTI